MGLIKTILGVGEEVAKPVEAVGDMFDKLFTSDEERAIAAAAMEKLRQNPYLIQAEINKVAASHKSWFVAGGRPALLWVTAMGWLMEFVANPIFQMFAGRKFEMPVDQMVWLTGAVLGIYGTLRTVEKVRGKTN